MKFVSWGKEYEVSREEASQYYREIYGQQLQLAPVEEQKEAEQEFIGYIASASLARFF